MTEEKSGSFCKYPSFFPPPTKQVKASLCVLSSSNEAQKETEQFSFCWWPEGSLQQGFMSRIDDSINLLFHVSSLLLNVPWPHHQESLTKMFVVEGAVLDSTEAVWTNLIIGFDSNPTPC